MIRIVLDTNVIVSSLLVPNPNSPPYIIRKKWYAGELEVLLSDRTHKEIIEVLERKHILGYSPAASIEIEVFRDGLPERAVIVPVASASGVLIPRDPKDDHIVTAAIVMKADAIVTGDKDLTSLGSYEGIPIMSPRQFLTWLENHPGAQA